MSDPATLRNRRDALSAQRSSGVARVSYDGKTVEYWPSPLKRIHL